MTDFNNKINLLQLVDTGFYLSIAKDIRFAMFNLNSQESKKFLFSFDNLGFITFLDKRIEEKMRPNPSILLDQQVISVCNNVIRVLNERFVPISNLINNSQKGIVNFIENQCLSQPIINKIYSTDAKGILDYYVNFGLEFPNAVTKEKSICEGLNFELRFDGNLNLIGFNYNSRPVEKVLKKDRIIYFQTGIDSNGNSNNILEEVLPEIRYIYNGKNQIIPHYILRRAISNEYGKLYGDDDNNVESGLVVAVKGELEVERKDSNSNEEIDKLKLGLNKDYKTNIVFLNSDIREIQLICQHLNEHFTEDGENKVEFRFVKTIRPEFNFNGFE